MATVRAPTFLGYENRAYYRATDGALDGPHLWTDQEVDDYRDKVGQPDDPATLDPTKTWRFFALEIQAEVWATESTNLEANDIGDIGDGKYVVRLPARDDLPGEIVLDKTVYTITVTDAGRTLSPAHAEIALVDNELTDLR